MKKRSQWLYWVILIVFIAIILLLIEFYGKKSKINNNSDNFTETSTGSSEQSNITNNPDASQPADQSSEIAKSKDSLDKFLKAISFGGNKSDTKTYSTSQFYASNFVSGIITGSKTGPDTFAITTQGEKNSIGYTFQVNESYNISKPNNAGFNGIYFYGVIKYNDQWLVNYRGEEKPQ